MSEAFCFIGNSHLAAMKLGWQDVQERYPSVDVDFFGSHRDKLKLTGIKGQAIEPLDPLVHENFVMTAGTPTIEIKKYVRIFIFAADFGFEAVAPLYRQFGLWSFNGRRPYLISESCFERAGQSLLEATAAMHLVRLIRAVSDVPVLISPQPLLTAAGRLPGTSDNIIDIISDAADGENVYGRFRRVCDNMTDNCLSIMMQPEHTRTNVVYTKLEYSEGSVKLSARLDVKHRNTDRRHMNRRFGAEIISALFADLGLEAIGPAPSLSAVN